MIKYDDFVEDISALSISGKRLEMHKDGNGAPRWYPIDTNQTISAIQYAVDLNRMERQLDCADASIARPGFLGLLNYSILGWIDGTDHQPVRCTVRALQDWPMFTSNHPALQMTGDSLTFSTTEYYTLADGQLFLGPDVRVKKFDGLVPLYIVSYSQLGEEYLDDYGKQGTMSLEILREYFGELPFAAYSILLRKALPLEPGVVPAFGMEHLQSSTFFGDSSGFRRGPMDQKTLIETMATYLHHMGHAFIPLRSYGDAYRPYVKEIPPIIRNIWFNEGFMWYIAYDALKSARWERVFYNNTFHADPQIRAMGLQELSQAASLMYSADFRLGKAVYSRGASMAMEMNAFIREKTAGKKSMKDVIRYMYYWSKENKRPFTMEELPTLMNKAAGVDLTEIYNKWQLPIK
jgi:predicted metalloprotease with PDZ domain